jgi:formiminotetrahydrofolate cyclodeaminase
MTAGFAEADETPVRASVLRAQLLEAGDADMRLYEPVLAAMRLPADDPTRCERLQHALSAASDPPLAIVRAATEVAELAASVSAHSKPSLRGDALAGAVLAEAAVRAAARLMEINLHDRRDDPRLAEAAELARRAARVLE